MNVLVTGSSDSRTLRELTVVGLDVVAGPFTSRVGSVTDRAREINPEENP